jgi:hypothetical protein
MKMVNHPRMTKEWPVCGVRDDRSEGDNIRNDTEAIWSTRQIIPRVDLFWLEKDHSRAPDQPEAIGDSAPTHDTQVSWLSGDKTG